MEDSRRHDDHRPTLRHAWRRSPAPGSEIRPQQDPGAQSPRPGRGPGGLSRRQLLTAATVLPLGIAVAGCGEQERRGDEVADGGSAAGGTLGSAEAPVTTAVIVSPATVFDVTTVFVPVGKPVRFTYRNEHTGVPHNFHVRGTDVDAKTVLRPGPDVQEVTVTFPAAGDFGYVCDVHPSMTGVVRAV